MNPTLRAAGALTLTATAALALSLAAPLAASATMTRSIHNVVTGTSPSDGATISELPELYSVSTSEPMLQLGEDAGFAMQITDAAGAFYGDGCLTVDGGTMSMGATAGEAGEYTVTWQIVSEDGHPESGTFAFAWAPASGATITPGSATPPVCGEAVATPSATPTPAETPEHTAGPGHAADPEPAELPIGTVIAIGVGVLLAAIAVAVALLVSARRRNGTTPPAPPAPPAE